MPLDQFILILGFIKPFYTHALLPLTGYYHGAFRAAKEKEIPCPYILAFSLYAVALSLVFQDFHSLARSIQLIGILLFFNYINKYNFSLTRIGVVLSIPTLIIFLLDLISGVKHFQKPIFGIEAPRLPGLLGEYNFSASAFLMFSLYFLQKRKYFFAFFYLLMILLTGSRGALLGLFIYFLSIPIFSLTKKYQQKVFKTICLSLILTPFLLVWVCSSLPVSKQARLNTILSKRVAIYQQSVEVIRQNPLGVGYFRISKYLEKRKKSSFLPYDATHTHNIILQILTSFGLFGLAFYILFFSKWDFSRNVFNYPSILAILFTFMSIDALHEIALYLPLLLRRSTSPLSLE